MTGPRERGEKAGTWGQVLHSHFYLHNVHLCRRLHHLLHLAGRTKIDTLPA